MTLAGVHEVVAALDGVLAGGAGTRVLLVEGPSGCGRSSVVDTVVERSVAHEALVLSAIGLPGEQDSPLGVLRQLVRGEKALAPLTATLDEITSTRSEDMQRLCRELADLRAGRPVVICVDDAHHADEASLDHLQYLARHARFDGLLIVVTVSLHHRPVHPAFLSDLMRRPGFRRVTLGRLGEEDVADLLRAVGRGAAAAPFYELSGGNPLLVRALVEECRDSTTPPAPRSAGPYAMAVAACLHRGGPVAASVAQACVLLGGLATPDRVARVTDMPAATAREALAALEASGILTHTRPLHPVARAAVLAGVSGGRRGTLHQRAALTLRADGCPPAEVAAHLLAAAEHDAPPAGDERAAKVLRETAETLLAEDDAPRALRLLELARPACADRTRQGADGIRLAQVAWRLDPAAAEQHVDTVVRALRSGSLDPGQVQPLVQFLMAQGRCADVAESAPGVAEPFGGPALGASASAVGKDDGDVPPGERVLCSARLTEATWVPIWHAVFALALSDTPGRAVVWSRRLLEEAERRRAPGWGAAFAELHAQALLRTGDVPGAAAAAARALHTPPEHPGRDGGTFMYGTAAVLVRALDALGQYTEASRLLDGPLPAGLFRTRQGLALLHARGGHQLAGGQARSALADFLEVGRLMTEWDIDDPAYLPWRTDAAQCLLRLGRPVQAERLARDQLALSGGRHPWARGLALRIQGLAACSAPRRASLLGQALSELRRSGDRAAAELVLTELARSAPRPELPVGAPDQATEVSAEAVRDTAEEGGGSEIRLSGSEQRVATLAAQGLTNREISARLYLTVSTVEQHLTRVYRKLRISSRRDLPLELAATSDVSAAH
ncbi:AAA family ATPase [Streptomyces kunmingensis]